MHITATRTALLALRDEVALAERSRVLLEDKRIELLKAFRRAAEQVLEGAEALEGAAGEGARALSWAVAADGPGAVGSAALASQASIRLEVVTAVHMGLRLPEIRHPTLGRQPSDRGYSMAGTSAHLDSAAQAYERQLALVLQVATLELHLRRLGEEIAKVTRRVNGLSHVVIPSRRNAATRIENILDEREREERFRLKRLSARKARRGP